MLGIFRQKPSLMDCAVQLADYFLMFPAIKQIALYGSLARLDERRKANDIDLVILHDGTLKDRMVSLENRVRQWNPYGVEIVPNWQLRYFIKEIFGTDALPLVRYLVEVVPSKVDVIFVHNRILTDCDYLRQFNVMDKDPDFSKRIFCETPLLGFDPLKGDFSLEIRHRGPSCGCFPARRWETVK